MKHFIKVVASYVILVLIHSGGRASRYLCAPRDNPAGRQASRP